MTIAGRTEINARRSRRFVSVMQTLSLTSAGEHKDGRPSTLLAHRWTRKARVSEKWSRFSADAHLRERSIRPESAVQFRVRCSNRPERPCICGEEVSGEQEWRFLPFFCFRTLLSPSAAPL